MNQGYSSSSETVLRKAPANKYYKELIGVKNNSIDIYSICEMYAVSPAKSHAVKKILMSGCRGVKSDIQDLKEAIEALQREIEIIESIKKINNGI